MILTLKTHISAPARDCPLSAPAKTYEPDKLDEKNFYAFNPEFDKKCFKNQMKK